MEIKLIGSVNSYHKVNDNYVSFEVIGKTSFGKEIKARLTIDDPAPELLKEICLAKPILVNVNFAPEL